MNLSSPKMIKIKGKTIIDKHSIAQSFWQLFANVDPRLSKKIPESKTACENF